MNGACKYCGEPWQRDYRCCVKERVDPPTARFHTLGPYYWDYYLDEFGRPVVVEPANPSD